jgi:hypothetical protein
MRPRQRSARANTARPAEAEVVLWLKAGLTRQGLQGRSVREVVEPGRQRAERQR